MTVTAFDLGTKRTGHATHDEHGQIVAGFVECPNYLRRSPMTPNKRAARLAWWYDQFAEYLGTLTGGDVVVFEGAVIQSRNRNGTIPSVELHGVFKLAAKHCGATLVEVPPTTIKKWATGNGNADKERMVAAAQSLGFDGEDDNAADAFLLVVMFDAGVIEDRLDEREQ